VGPEAALGGPIALLRNGDIIDIDAKKGTINVRLSKAELAKRKRKWKAKKSDFGSGTIWKYAQTVGPAYLGHQHILERKKKLENILRFNENKTSYFMWWCWHKALAKF
jgi:dihydroxy-acid dehydratase